MPGCTEIHKHLISLELRRVTSIMIELIMTDAVARRLLKKVDSSHGMDGCWYWRGNRSPAGYGLFMVKRRRIAAHRAVWLALRGEIPDGMLVLHDPIRCWNRACCNPEHMRLGTRKDAQDGAFEARALLRDKAVGQCEHGELLPRYCFKCRS